LMQLKGFGIGLQHKLAKRRRSSNSRGWIGFQTLELAVGGAIFSFCEVHSTDIDVRSQNWGPKNQIGPHSKKRNWNIHWLRREIIVLTSPTMRHGDGGVPGPTGHPSGQLSLKIARSKTTWTCSAALL
jgi:hypothetical protein